MPVRPAWHGGACARRVMPVRARVVPVRARVVPVRPALPRDRSLCPVATPPSQVTSSYLLSHQLFAESLFHYQDIRDEDPLTIVFIRARVKYIEAPHRTVSIRIAPYR